MKVSNSSRSFCLSGIALFGLLLGVGCISPMTEDQLESELRQTANSISDAPRAKRIVPIHADTRMAAWTMLTAASNNPQSSPLSRQLGVGFALGSRRQVLYVVGGNYPKLVDRILRNAFAFNEGTSLKGLKLVLVSPAAPSQELKLAVNRAGARLEFRPLP